MSLSLIVDNSPKNLTPEFKVLKLMAKSKNIVIQKADEGYNVVYLTSRKELPRN